MPSVKNNNRFRTFSNGDNVLASNLRPGPKWYNTTITEVLGINIYNVFIHELNTTWKRHIQQLLPSSIDNNNVSNNCNLNSNENVIHVPDRHVPLEIVSDNVIVYDNVNISQSLPVNSESAALRRSTRIKKPIEIYVAGNK